MHKNKQCAYRNTQLEKQEICDGYFATELKYFDV